MDWDPRRPLLLPILIVAMLPVIIFGSLFGTGTDTPSGITDDAVLTQNMVDLNAGISSILSEGLTDVLNRIDANFADSGCDQKEVNNPYGADVVFNANAFIAMYCASKDTDVESISQSDLESLLNTHLDKLYAFTYQDESREVEGEPDPETGEATTETITVRVYTITYNGESYFSDEIFHLSEEQKALSNDYAQNLSVFLGDGSYQVLSSTEFSADGLSYEGVVFTDGETQVVYYNQLDERWKNLPYGTDDIGGYACGPTSDVDCGFQSDLGDHRPSAHGCNGRMKMATGPVNPVPITRLSLALQVPGGLRVRDVPPQSRSVLSMPLPTASFVVALMTKGHFTKPATSSSARCDFGGRDTGGRPSQLPAFQSNMGPVYSS